MLKNVQQQARHHTRPVRDWLKLLWQRIDEDNMTTLAGNLAYVSLLSLVPLIAVVFALFAAFPMFSDVSVQLRHFILEQNDGSRGMRADCHSVIVDVRH